MNFESFSLIMREFLKFQKDELFSYHLYKELSKEINQKVLEELALQEKKHYNLLKSITKKELSLNSVDKFKIFALKILSKLLGAKFIIKLLEKGEEEDIKKYEELMKKCKDEKVKAILSEILEDEKKHEKKLVELLRDKRVENLDVIVLGMNDALVELTGAVIGFTGLFNDNLRVALAGLVTGLAASLSMAASSYLSKKAEKNDIKLAFQAALYTGISYFITVLIIVFPFLLVKSKLAVFWSLANVLLVVAFYSFYYSIVKDGNFKKEFVSMSLISLGVSLISYILGKLADFYILS